MGLSASGCVADPLVPCGSFDAGEAGANRMARENHGPVMAVAMNESFVLRNICEDGACELRRLVLLEQELSPGSQVMLTTRGNYLVGINRDDGRMWTYEFDESGRRKSKTPSYVHETDGPAKLVMGLRNSNRLIVRDRQNRLALFVPGHQNAIPIDADLDETVVVAAVGEHHAALQVKHTDSQSVYLVDLGYEPQVGDVDYVLPPPTRTPTLPRRVARGDFKSIVFGPNDATLVLSEGRGDDARVLVFDVGTMILIDAFEGEVISSREQNDANSIEELPGLHALSPSGEHIAYRTVSGALAVRQLTVQSSCLVRNTNRLGTGREPRRNDGNHPVAGFSASGVIYAEYSVGQSDSYVYAYEPRRQKLVPLGSADGGWHLAAVPGSMTNSDGDHADLWAVGVHNGSHVSIASNGVDGETVGRELTFMPRFDAGIWAIDTDDEVVHNHRKRALSVRRVEPPYRADGTPRFDQEPDDQVVNIVDILPNTDEQDEVPVTPKPLRVPLTGRLCLTTGSPGSWAYRCGDSTGRQQALTSSSGAQEQVEPNELPEFDPPPPIPADEPDDDDDDDPARDD